MLLLIHSIVGAAALLSLVYSARRLHPLEAVLTFMFASSAVQNIEIILSSNMKLLKIPTEVNVYLTFHLDRIVVYPMGLFWLSFFLRHSRYSLVMKISIAVLGLFTLTAGQYWENRLTVITMQKWGIAYSLLEWGALLAVTVGFSLLIRKMLMKVKVNSSI
ncbi:hypothetical protein ACFQ88_11255 [Paenibacillus sp. NPDC056579]|uniref:hypothetical protein n=1 Tax=Paenibacillus sp. NPDC056579 TaxID=3345871 RepID=UPI003688B9B8